MVDAGETAESEGPYSLRGFAEWLGVNAMAISRAIKEGRISKAVVRVNGQPKIADRELAKREFYENGDYTRAPQRAPGALTTPPRPPPPPPDDPEDPEEPKDAPRSAHEGMNLNEANAIKAVWQAKQAELKYREHAGELVEASKVSKRLTDVFSQCRTALLGIPSRARQALPHLNTADIGELERLIREALEALADGAAQS